MMRAKIKNCGLEFVFQCPQNWDALTRTAKKDVRHCEVCSQLVHFCDTTRKAEKKASEGFCVALSPEIETEEWVRFAPPKRRQPRLGKVKVRLGPKPEVDTPPDKGEWRRQRSEKRGRNKKRRP